MKGKSAKKPVKKVPAKRVRVALPEFNLNHPQVAHLIEEAFIVEGIQYYRFKKEAMIPTGRYKWVMQYIREVDNRMDMETLLNYMKVIENTLSGNGNKSINLLTIAKVVEAIKTRAKLGFEPETAKRLASVVYFDETESLDGFDFEYGSKKIAIWDEHIKKQRLKVAKGEPGASLDFFTTTPIGELLHVNEASITSLLTYLEEATMIIKELTSDLSQALEEKQSGNMMST